MDNKGINSAALLDLKRVRHHKSQNSSVEIEKCRDKWYRWVMEERVI